MKRNWWSVLHFSTRVALLAIFVAALAYRPAKAGTGLSEAPNMRAPIPSEGIPTNQLIVKYRSNTDLGGNYAPAGEIRLQALRAVSGERLEYFRALSHTTHVLRLPDRLAVIDVERIARAISALPDIEYAEPDYVMFSTLTPNDAQYGNQWHYFDTYGINAPTAWEITTGASSVRIAVLDTGITDHADLAGRWLGGYDFISDVPTANDGNGRDSDPHDPGNWITSAESSSGPFAGCPVTNSTWHGTHVAGTIGAASNNGIGVAGVNWASKIIPIRVLGKCGGFTSDIADGMRWAAGLSISGVPDNPNPARILNLSFGGPGVCSTTYQNAINAVTAVGSMIVVAAGNNSSNLNTNSFQPANCNGVITVAATDRGGQRAIYSNFGSTVEISAPGGETVPILQDGILSTLNTGTTTPASDTYGYYAGTSMAAPHVSGVISLMLSFNPALTASQVIQILQSTARAFPAGSNCTTSTCGSGIVDAANALEAVPPPPVTATPTITATSTPTATFTSTFTFTPTNTPTPTRTPTATNTATHTLTATQTPTRTPTRTATASSTSSFTPTNTATPTPSYTSVPPTATFTGTSTFTPTNTPTRTHTATATRTPTRTPTRTATATSTSSLTPTITATPTPSHTPAPPTATFTRTFTLTPTKTPTRTQTAAATRTPTPTPTKTLTPSHTPISPTVTFTITNAPNKTATATLGTIPTQVSSFLSQRSRDGWILESSENSGVGGSKNKGGLTLRLGDDIANKQYRSILSFDTSALPDNGVIVSVTIKFKRAGISGINPFTTHGKLVVDIRRGAFRNNPVLQTGDFNAPAAKNKILILNNNMVDNWFSGSLNSVDLQYVNLSGLTQFRLRFGRDDNNDFNPDFLKIYSGNASEENRPQLIVVFYVP